VEALALEVELQLDPALVEDVALDDDSETTVWFGE
jgi:hypothetical protein